MPLGEASKRIEDEIKDGDDELQRLKVWFIFFVLSKFVLVC
jgi:hypothetical protein